MTRIRKVGRIRRKINGLTGRIAREYKKENPSRQKIGKWAEQAGRLLKRIKKPKA